MSSMSYINKETMNKLDIDYVNHDRIPNVA